MKLLTKWDSYNHERLAQLLGPNRCNFSKKCTTASILKYYYTNNLVDVDLVLLLYSRSEKLQQECRCVFSIISIDS